MIFRLLIIFYLIGIVSFTLYSQTNRIDSLKLELESATDTTHINILNQIAADLVYKDFDEAKKYATEALNISDSLGYVKGRAFSIWNLALADAHRENNEKTIDLLSTCLKLFIELDYKVYVAGSYHMIGAILSKQGLFSQSLEYQFKGLEVNEEYGNPQYLSASLRHIGNVYRLFDDYNKALEFYIKSLKLVENKKHTITLARILESIGSTYSVSGNFKESLKYHKRSASIAQELNSYFDLAIAENQIGYVYNNLNLPQVAIPYLERSINSFKEFKSSQALATSYSNLSDSYKRLEYFEVAKKFAILSYEAAKESGLPVQVDILDNLYKIYEKSGDYKNALKYQGEYLAAKDSIYNDKSKRDLARAEITYEFEQKQKLEDANRERDIFILFSGIGFLLIIVIAGIFYTRTLGRKNKLISEQKEKLEELDKIKSNFFANISHEFRTPLTLILSPIRSLRKSMKDDEHKNELLLVETNANKLLRFVNQLLALSKFESGEMAKNLQRIDLVDYIKFITESFVTLAKRDSIEYNQTFQLQHLVTDFYPDHLEQLIFNILSNAFKFTKKNESISVKLTVANPAGQLADENEVLTSENISIKIIVNDTGIGIEKENLDRIFDRFYQVEQSTTRGYEGTGIGLSLVKELVEFYNGNINIESEVGKGTEVTVSIPLGKIYSINETIQTDQDHITIKSEEKQIAESEVYNVTEHNVDDSIKNENVVLIVEDSNELRIHITKMLGKDFKVIEAENGEDGFEIAIENVPDLIISDIMMPKMDGNEMSRRLKSDQRTSHIPIILLTAKAAIEDKIEGLETGAIDYITKPFDSDELKIKISNQIEIRKELHNKFKSENLIKLSEIEVTSIEEKFLQKAVKIVEENIENENFSVEDLASEIGLSRVQLHRKISALTNKPTTYFIRSIRLERAAQLIEKGAGNVTEVAYMVGFNSQSYFTKRFVEHFGKSPSEFQKQ